jgi:fumarate reductase flavoprotein subunit
MKRASDRQTATRRGFLKQAAVAGGAVAGMAALARPAAAQTAAVGAIAWDREADVVIIGSGAAGLSAAVEAADSKAEVVVLEKMPQIGGVSRVSGGNYGSYGTPVQAKAAEKEPQRFGGDSADLYYKEKLLLGGYLNDPAVVRVFADLALDGYNWLTSLGFTHDGIRFYSSLGPNPMPENPKGMHLNMLWNTPFEKGKWDGPFSKGRHHTGGKYLNFINGEAGVMCLADNARKRGVQILTQMEVLEIVRQGNLSGAVLGVKVKELASNKLLLIRARRGVVLAAGGFTANGKMCQRYDPRLSPAVRASGEASPGAAGAGCTGEALLAAMDIGADATLLHMQQLRMAGSAVAYSGPGSTLVADKDGTYIDVDPQGNRFWMEGGDQAVYREARLTVLHEKGFHQWWGICDSKGANKAYLRGALAAKSALAADTLAQLAAIIQVPPATLAATVSRYNTFVDRGSDEDFGMFREVLKLKIDSPPFYAMPKTYYRHHSLGGVRITPSSQVLDRHDRAIPRLYSAGEVTGSVHGWERNGGCGWTDCVVFGRIAGRKAAGEAPWA